MLIVWKGLLFLYSNYELFGVASWLFCNAGHLVRDLPLSGARESSLYSPTEKGIEGGVVVGVVS